MPVKTEIQKKIFFYNILLFSKRDLDFVNLMTYDLHGNWESETGHNAPMYPRSGEVGDQRNLNVQWVVNYWINNGCPREKLTLGLGAYGRTFRLTNANNNGLGIFFINQIKLSLLRLNF